ncbi:MAG: flagellar hook-basal body complex protein [Vampirovibrionales bacterium]|nr:flagellar hook-basal body complex protein [Vampirovibrionales bacterium]
MTRGFFTAMSGIRANQTRLDVISSNLANINTIAFKGSRVNFANVFSDVITSGTAPNGSLGGTNPIQIGAGATVSDIQTSFSQGGTQFTGQTTDLMINGEGFFAISKPSDATNNTFYMTRAGNFTLDSSGSLVTSAGYKVRGTSQVSGSGPTTLSNVQIPQQLMVAKDLDVNNAIIGSHFATAGTATASFTAAQTPGTTSQKIETVNLVNFSIGKDGAVTGTYSNGDRISVRTDAGTVVTGSPTSSRREIIHLTVEGATLGADNDGDGASSTATDNGIVKQIAGAEVFTAPAGGNAMEGMQLQLQSLTVTNPAGLVYEGNSMFTMGANSGTSFFGAPGSESRGVINAGALESSNVDLANEFTNLIVTQRGLEASTRVIQTQSEVLQAIINIL